jgi:hypothetical protein
MRWIPYVSFTLSLFVCGWMSWFGFSFVHTVTCEPSPPPASFRFTFAIAGLVGEIACNVGAIVGLSRKTVNGAIVAGFLPWVAMGLGFIALAIPLFAASLC